MGFLRSLFTRQGPPPPVSPLSDAHRERQRLFARYWEYYRGLHKRHLKTRDNGPDDNVTINLSKKIVLASTYFLFGKEVAFEIDEETDRTPEEQYLDDVWGDRPLEGFSKMAFLADVAINGGVFGHPFIRLYPPAEGRRLPRLVNLDPYNLDVITDPDDMSRVLAYHVVWHVGETWKRDRIECVSDTSWEIVREIWQVGQRWAMEDEPEPWPWPFPPIFHCKNLPNPRGFWGASDLEDADLNDAINFVRSNTNRIVRYHAHPKTVVSGTTPGQIEATAVDGLWSLPSGATVTNLEMQSDLASSREHAADLVRHFHDITSTPAISPVDVQVGALSGFALRILYGPLIEKNQIKRRSYGGMLSRLNMAILVTSGKTKDPEIVVRNIWQDPLPIAGKERAEELAILTGAGASIYGAAKVVGYTEEEAELLSQVETFEEDFVR